VAAMLTLLHTDPDPFVREGTVEALGRLSAGHVSALDGLVAALHDDVAGVRRRAAIQLKVLGAAAAPRAKAARHALTRLADDDTEEPELRTQARAAIDAMGSAPL
jgi:HEAT repeat protein